MLFHVQRSRLFQPPQKARPVVAVENSSWPFLHCGRERPFYFSGRKKTLLATGKLITFRVWNDSFCFKPVKYVGANPYGCSKLHHVYIYMYILYIPTYNWGSGLLSFYSSHNGEGVALLYHAIRSA